MPKNRVCNLVQTSFIYFITILNQFYIGLNDLVVHEVKGLEIMITTMWGSKQYNANVISLLQQKLGTCSDVFPNPYK